jgi:hypothetical protein
MLFRQGRQIPGPIRSPAVDLALKILDLAQQILTVLGRTVTRLRSTAPDLLTQSIFGASGQA